MNTAICAWPENHTLIKLNVSTGNNRTARANEKRKGCTNSHAETPLLSWTTHTFSSETEQKWRDALEEKLLKHLAERALRERRGLREGALRAGEKIQAGALRERSCLNTVSVWSGEHSGGMKKKELDETLLFFLYFFFWWPNFIYIQFITCNITKQNVHWKCVGGGAWGNIQHKILEKASIQWQQPLWHMNYGTELPNVCCSQTVECSDSNE